MFIRVKTSVITILFSFCAPFAFETLAQAHFIETSRLVASGQNEKALRLVEESLPPVSLSYDQLSLDQRLTVFAAGVLAERLGFYKVAESNLLRLRGNDFILSDYVALYLARALHRQGRKAEAKTLLQEIGTERSAQHLVLQAKEELAEIALAENKWTEARQQLTYLERKQRGLAEEPRILWQLMGVELQTNRTSAACQAARKLYWKFPTHPLVSHWGTDLQKADYQGKKIGCAVSESERGKRIKRLQLLGEAQRARAEITEMINAALPEQRKVVDFRLVDFLVREGEMAEAFKVLLPYQETHSKDYNYQMLFARVASQAGEELKAIAAYDQAYQLTGASKAGRAALFQAALVSSMIRDYDGATRRFSEFKRKNPHSGLSRDVAWHLAWIQYSRKDYAGAINAFNEILTQKRRHARWWQSFSEERVKYWLAMSYKNLNQLALAQDVFKDLSEAKLVPYYSVVAGYRHQGLENLRQPSSAETEADVAASAAELSLALSLDSQESEEQLTAEPNSEMEISESDESIEGVEDINSIELEISNPRVRAFFERANLFLRLGLLPEAKWELFAVEGRTRDRQMLRKLLPLYELTQAFHRSSHIATHAYWGERARTGLSGSRSLWEFAYPSAFAPEVSKSAKDFAVAPEFVWSIIRAETHYRTEAVSPVGAVGLMQLMPNTAKQVSRLIASEVKISDLFVPATNIRLGTSYLSRLLKRFEGNIALAAAAYNAGPHRVDRWLSHFNRSGNGIDMDEFVENIPYAETRDYVKKVLSNFKVYNQLYGGKHSLEWLAKPLTVKPKSADFSKESWEG